MIAYPSNVRWLGYETKRGSKRNLASGRWGTLRLAIVSVGCAAAAWGVMHLTLHLLR